MSARIKIDELPTFDAAPYLDSEEALTPHKAQKLLDLGQQYVAAHLSLIHI